MAVSLPRLRSLRQARSAASWASLRLLLLSATSPPCTTRYFEQLPATCSSQPEIRREISSSVQGGRIQRRCASPRLVTSASGRQRLSQSLPLRAVRALPAFLHLASRPPAMTEPTYRTHLKLPLRSLSSM